MIPQPLLTSSKWVGRSISIALPTARTKVSLFPAKMEEVPAEPWIKCSWLKEDAVISEQTVPMPSYNGCFSLIWVCCPIEDRPTVEDELLREFNPDDFTIRCKRWPR
jgi:hypothetical protein